MLYISACLFPLLVWSKELKGPDYLRYKTYVNTKYVLNQNLEI